MAYLVVATGTPALAVGASPRFAAGGAALAALDLLIRRCVEQCKLTPAVAGAPPRILEASIQEAAHVLRTTPFKQHGQPRPRFCVSLQNIPISNAFSMLLSSYGCIAFLKRIRGNVVTHEVRSFRGGVY